MKRLHVIGKKNCGKTTLVVDLVTYWTNQGLRVGTIKHTHHQHELDVPGKDSFRHRQAGAASVGILSPGMIAVFHPVVDASGHKHYDRLAPMFADCDLVLVEGDSAAAATRVEVWRAAAAAEPYALADEGIRTVISDDEVPGGLSVIRRTPLDELAAALLRLVDLDPTS